MEAVEAAAAMTNLEPSPRPARGDALLLHHVLAVGGSGWLQQATPAGDPGYVDETNIIRVPMSLGGVSAESYFFAPFGFEGNAMVALLKAPGAGTGFALFTFHMGGGSPDSRREPPADRGGFAPS